MSRIVFLRSTGTEIDDGTLMTAAITLNLVADTTYTLRLTPIDSVANRGQPVDVTIVTGAQMVCQMYALKSQADLMHDSALKMTSLTPLADVQPPQLSGLATTVSIDCGESLLPNNTNLGEPVVTDNNDVIDVSFSDTGEENCAFTRYWTAQDEVCFPSEDPPHP